MPFRACLWPLTLKRGCIIIIIIIIIIITTIIIIIIISISIIIIIISIITELLYFSFLVIRECPIFFRPHSKAVFSRSIHSDTEFLSQQMVMDYSLLVGIDEAKAELVLGIIGKLLIRDSRYPQQTSLLQGRSALHNFRYSGLWGNNKDGGRWGWGSTRVGWK